MRSIPAIALTCPNHRAAPGSARPGNATTRRGQVAV